MTLASFRRGLNATIIRMALINTALLVVVGSTQAQPRAKKDEKPTESEFARGVRSEIAGAFDQFKADGNIAQTNDCLTIALDKVIAGGEKSDRTLWRDAAVALRLGALIAGCEESTRADRVEYLLQNPELARALTLLVKPQVDKVPEVFALLDRLRAKHGQRLNTYAELAAAICVVHDVPMGRRINENMVHSADPVHLFEYFVANEKRMFFGIKSVPAELLIYVVDSTASVDEMAWALHRYAGDKNVGARFFDIKYDVDHFQDGDAKKVTSAGYSLPHILQFGGVCADQAYFAMTVGKAIGVPTTYTTGASSEVGHAWVGFLQADGRRAWWNFDSGRYEAYQGVRGNVLDPQTRKHIPDSYVALLAEYVLAKELDRQAAVAFADGARRLVNQVKMSKPSASMPAATNEATPPLRTANVADALALLETGLSAAPGLAEGWGVLESLAASGRLTLEDKKRWEGVLYRLCGQRYPDFYLAVLKPMIESVPDVDEQNSLWNGAFKRFQDRPDLAAIVRMEQAQMWMQAQKAARAGQCYEDVINRFANAGPFVIDALVRAEKILRDAGEGRRVLTLYDRAWSQIQKPRTDMAANFARQSNWYRVGSMYAKRLDEAGLGGDAVKVRSAIGAR